jgi:hypothetical protein
MLAEGALSVMDASAGATALAAGGFAAAPALALGTGLLGAGMALDALINFDDDAGEDALQTAVMVIESLRSDLWIVRDQVVDRVDERADELLRGIDEVLDALDAAEARAQEQARERRHEHGAILLAVLDGTVELAGRDLALLEARYDASCRWSQLDARRFRRDLSDAYALLSVDPLAASHDAASQARGNLASAWRSLARTAIADDVLGIRGLSAWAGVEPAQVAHPLMLARCARLFGRMTRGAFWLVDPVQLERWTAELRRRFEPTMRYAFAAAHPSTLAALASAEWRRLNGTWRAFSTASTYRSPWRVKRRMPNSGHRRRPPVGTPASLSQAHTQHQTI